MPIKLSIADFVFKFEGQNLCDFIGAMPFFQPFVTESSRENDFTVSEELDEMEVSRLRESCNGVEPYFHVDFEDVDCQFYRIGNKLIFHTHEEHSQKELWEIWEIGSDIVRTSIVRATATERALTPDSFAKDTPTRSF